MDPEKIANDSNVAENQNSPDTDIDANEWMNAGNKTPAAKKETEKEDDEDEQESNSGSDQGNEPNFELRKEEEKKDLGAQDDGKNVSGNILSGLKAEGEDNEFSLDDDEDDSAAGATEKEKEGATQKTTTDREILSRIAKEFEIEDVQEPEQLISSLKRKLENAAAGAEAPVGKLDEILKWADGDLLKAKLINEQGFEEADADEYIAENVKVYGEEWLSLQARPIRVFLKQQRNKIVEGHIQQQEVKAKNAAAFGDGVRTHIKTGLKTLYGIPLKPYVNFVREFQAQMKDPKTIAELQSDPKSFADAMFALKYGEKILNEAMKKHGKDLYEKGWEASTKANVDDIILNKDNKGRRTGGELPLNGTKSGEVDIKEWTKSNRSGKAS